ncbi:MAG: hypothetical protein ACE5K0_03795 [Candidatus Methanofastidiosia archaeon]
MAKRKRRSRKKSILKNPNFLFFLILILGIGTFLFYNLILVPRMQPSLSVDDLKEMLPKDTVIFETRELSDAEIRELMGEKNPYLPKLKGIYNVYASYKELEFLIELSIWKNARAPKEEFHRGVFQEISEEGMFKRFEIGDSVYFYQIERSGQILFGYTFEEYQIHILVFYEKTPSLEELLIINRTIFEIFEGFPKWNLRAEEVIQDFVRENYVP